MRIEIQEIGHAMVAIVFSAAVFGFCALIKSKCRKALRQKKNYCRQIRKTAVL